MFEYIDENLIKIKDTSKVLCYRPYKMNGKVALYAIITKEIGEYEFIPLSKPKMSINFPIQPIYHFYNECGRSVLKNFVCLNNYYAFNKEYFTGLGYSELFYNTQKYALYAKFKDGSATYLANYKKDSFMKKGIVKLRKFLNENGIEPKYDSISKTAPFIEDYLNDKVSIIPSLVDINDDEKE